MEVGKAHQRIIREEMAEKEKHNLFGSWWETVNKAVDKTEIKEIHRKHAEPIILKYEWLGTLPANCTKYTGLFFDGTLGGVCCFTNVKFGGKYTIFGYKAYCLCRGACAHWVPKWGASKLISGSLKLLFGDGEPIVIVAYSDWSAGEIGTVYQACNWTYLGHSETREYIGPSGKRYDINTPAVRAVPGFKRKNNKDLKATPEMIKIEKAKMERDGYVLKDGPTRGRYVYVAGKKCKEKKHIEKFLKTKSKPYPKRDKTQIN